MKGYRTRAVDDRDEDEIAAWQDEHVCDDKRSFGRCACVPEAIVSRLADGAPECDCLTGEDHMTRCAFPSVRANGGERVRA